jgi:hypothetical protein
MRVIKINLLRMGLFEPAQDRAVTDIEIFTQATGDCGSQQAAERLRAIAGACERSGAVRVLAQRLKQAFE